ncbi:MAG: hypothetical protein GEU78_13870 [Actinobacteria bacterium]|nr:hypothetical protein [Actinomycetota bacterium]
MGELIILDPRTWGHLSMEAVSRSWDTLDRLRVGVIDNTKPNFDNVAQGIVSVLKASYGVSEVEFHRKRTATAPAADEVYDRFGSTADLVLTGSGD